jgi:3-oxoacyl-[acyl-carrier protein] reductase
MDNSVNGRVALVTGASRGIGAAVAARLAREGAGVAINYLHSADKAEELAHDLVRAGLRAVTVKGDVARAEDVSAMVQQIAQRLGRIDILVNNAGIATRRDLEELSIEDFDQTISVNLRSVFLCIKAVLPMMQSNGWGRIVNITSGAARGAGTIGPHYNASKAGVEGLTRGYAARLVAKGITVNAVAPTLIATDMMAGQDELARRIPLGRFGRPEEVAQVVMMVIGNPYMTGQTVGISGGMHFN